MTIALDDARKHAVRNQRRLRLVKTELGTAPNEQVENPESAVVKTQQKERLLAALEQLSERDREIVTLRYGAGLETEEVAALCDTSGPNVRKVCERQRRRLLEILLNEPRASDENVPRGRRNDPHRARLSL